jgi:hypothetical protein
VEKNRIVFRVSAGLTAALALGALTPYRAYTAPLLQSDPVFITLRSTACCQALTGPVAVDQESHPAVPLQDFALFLTYVEIFGSRFPTRLAPDLPFASALATQIGMLHAGASGIVFNQMNYMEAEITYTTAVTNVGDTGGTAVLDYTIPVMEVGLLAGDGIVGPSATVRATSSSVHTLRDGRVLPPQELFLYEMILLKDVPTNYLPTFSPDLLRDFGSPEVFREDGLVFFRTPEKSLSLQVAELLPGETLLVTYRVIVSTDTGGASEVGMQALFGDPLSLNVPTTGGFSLSLGSPAAVPEPATSALLAAGLVMAALLRRHWAHRRPGM